MGTGSPGYALEVERTGENAAIVAKRVSGALCYINATATAGNFGTTTNHPLRLMVNGGERMKLPTSGNLLEMSDGGYYDGTWHGSSSREIKENIQTLTSGEAINALEKLDPVKFNYKENKEDEHVGFIAEDVPELVASKNRKALSAMDVVAVLTKVVKEQQKSIQEHQKTISELQKEIAELKKK
jgi:molybdopterin converting factor small subunit